MKKKQSKSRVKEKIYFHHVSEFPKNSTKVNINIYSKRLPKDVLTQDVIDYDFMKIGLNPPKKLKRQYYHQYFVTSSYSALRKDKNKNSDSNKTSSSGGGGSRGIKNNKQQKQKCMFKCFYSNDRKQHKKFLNNYMPQKNIEDVVDKPNLFNSDYDVVTPEKILDYEQNMDDMHYKFILSPESQKVPIKEFVRSYIKQVEALTGYEFIYVAVEHKNTGHNHAHILINGVDKNGKKVHFDRDFFKEVGRNIAANLCTNYVGYRTQEQIEASKKKELSAFHLTSYDKNIVDNEFKYQEIKIIDGIEYEGEIIVRNEKMKKRLEILQNIGFAKIKKDTKVPPIFYLTKNWESSMRTARNFNSFLKARTNLLYTTACNLEQYKKDTGEISGTITQKFIMNNEDNWNNAVVIENKKTGKSYYVPVGFEPTEKIIGCDVNCYIPTGLMHPKIVVQNKKRTEEINKSVK